MATLRSLIPPFMENPYRQQRQASFFTLRRVYDLTMAILILSVAFALVFLDRIAANLTFTAEPLYRYGFAGVCFLYGLFRLYRATQNQN